MDINEALSYHHRSIFNLNNRFKTLSELNTINHDQMSELSQSVYDFQNEMEELKESMDEVQNFLEKFKEDYMKFKREMLSKLNNVDIKSKEAIPTVNQQSETSKENLKILEELKKEENEFKILEDLKKDIDLNNEKINNISLEMSE